MVEDFVIQAVLVQAENAVRRSTWEVLAREADAAALAYEAPLITKDVERKAA